MTARHFAPALACVAVLSTLPAAAGPSQAGVHPPGGLVAACASDFTAGVTYTPGGDLLAAFSAYPARTSCQGQYFAGTAGSTAAADYATSTVHNQASAAAPMGVMGLGAKNASPGNEWFPVGVAGGGWSETMVVELPGHSGESAVWRFTRHVDGTMASTGGAGRGLLMVNAFKNEVELMNDIAGFDQGNSDANATDRQRVAWGVSHGAGRLVDDMVTFAVPLTLGQSFDWGVYATALASMRSFSSDPAISTAELDFGADGLQYGGSAGLFIGGVAMDGYTLQSASGIGWMQAAAVPEPGTWSLMFAGLVAMCGIARRRMV